MLKKVNYTSIYQPIPERGNIIFHDITVFQFWNGSVCSRYIRLEDKWIKDILMIKKGFRSLPVEQITDEELLELLHKATDKSTETRMYMLPDEGGMVLVA